MSTDSELMNAALELRNHAWLERFRKATGDNGYSELSPAACNDIAGYVDRFIDKVLAQRADDGELIDADWLKSIGFCRYDFTIENSKTGFEDWEIEPPDGGDTVEIRVYRESGLTCDCWINKAGLSAAPQTRGQLRQLLSALSVNTEGGEG